MASRTLAVVAAVGLAGNTDAFINRKGRAFLSSDMRPEAAAEALMSVEDEWRAEASLFAECSNSTSEESEPLVDCHAAPSAFQKSCGTVVNAIVQGSNGNRATVHEYLDTVCSQAVMNGYHQNHCRGIANALSAKMTGDIYTNRNVLNLKALCNDFWPTFLEEERHRLVQEAAAREAAEQAAAFAKAKTEADEEAKAKAEALAKAHAEAEEQAKAAAEELRAKEEEAKMQAEADARAKAEEAKPVAKEELESSQNTSDVANALMNVHNNTEPLQEPLSNSTA